MLKGISHLLSPELLKILMEMGHGDEILLGDANFPAASHAQRLVRADGLAIPALLNAILPLFPLDYTVDFAAVVMLSPAKDPNVWKTYREILNAHPDGNKPFLIISKPDFYERAKKAYTVVATGEAEKFANIIIRKGIIVD